jgi:nucleotide-binding universal stress UspA family protein
MFDKILFATTASPCSDDAAHVAFDMAKRYDSKCLVLHVLGFPTRGFSHRAVNVRTGRQEDIGPASIRGIEEEIRGRYSKEIDGLHDCAVLSMPGVPHSEILRLARKEDVDLIVMGAHTGKEEKGAEQFKRIVGSTMQHVAKKARCPVLIVSRPCTTCFLYFSNVVVGTDFSRASMYSFLFAAKVAREIGCRLHLIHVIAPAAEAEIEERRKAAENKLRALYLSKVEEVVCEIEVRVGVPHEQILKLATEREADLIIMAHHTRDMDPETALLGSTVEQVVLNSSCPVASVNCPDKNTGAADNPSINDFLPHMVPAV